MIPPARKREATGPPPGKHPSKVLCTRPVLAQHSMVKMEPNTPSPTSTTIDASPLSMYTQEPPQQMLSSPNSEEAKPDIDTMTNRLVQLTLTVPRDSALHLLRCAYGEITAAMAKDKGNPEQYFAMARDIEQQICNY